MRHLEVLGKIDVQHLLPKVQTPTLVMHVRDDLPVSIAAGRELAAGIPNARFVALPGKNHILLEQDPGLAQFSNELKSFVSASS